QDAEQAPPLGGLHGVADVGGGGLPVALRAHGDHVVAGDGVTRRGDDRGGLDLLLRLDVHGLRLEGDLPAGRRRAGQLHAVDRGRALVGDHDRDAGAVAGGAGGVEPLVLGGELHLAGAADLGGEVDRGVLPATAHAEADRVGAGGDVVRRGGGDAVRRGGAAVHGPRGGLRLRRRVRGGVPARRALRLQRVGGLLRGAVAQRGAVVEGVGRLTGELGELRLEADRTGAAAAHRADGTSGV